MYELASLIKVVYAIERDDLRSVLNIREFFRKRAAAPFPAPSELRILNPVWPRTYRYSALDREFSNAYIRRLQRQLDTAERRIVYAWHPEFVQVVKRLSYDVLVYHPYDMFRHFFNQTHQIVQEEKELCRIADVVITPHNEIAQALAHPNSHVVSNGVFLPAFPDRSTIKAAATITEIKRPIIGNLGVINDKIDFDLLLSLFTKRPEWQLVFVGFEGSGNWKETTGYKTIRTLKNVHFLGGVPINNAASMISGFDVGIIPYCLSGWAKFIESPLKLYQYWAMGVPVVSSALPTLQRIPGALEVPTAIDEWDAAIEEQLNACNGENPVALRERAESHSWAAKAKEIASIIDQYS